MPVAGLLSCSAAAAAVSTASALRAVLMGFGLPAMPAFFSHHSCCKGAAGVALLHHRLRLQLLLLQKNT